VIWALAQHDVKRLLAFHSVENIGIILLGMGAGVLGLAYARPAIAVLGFAGAAMHTVNHALFKSLLFLGAGSMGHGTGTRAIDRLGGLARRMPRTTAAFVVGAAAIVGLPPLNGFVSEWLVFRALAGWGAADGAGRAAVLAAPVLGLIGALALACFAKVVGVMLLGTPRDPAASAARESPAGLVRPLFGLAAACAAIGLVPAVAVGPALRVGAVVAGGAGVPGVLAASAPLTAFTLALAAALAAGALVVRATGGVARRLSDTWGCGYPAPSARMQYTASSFAAPLLAPFAPLSGLRAHRAHGRFSTHAADPVLDQLLRPAWNGARGAALRLRPFQHSRLSSRLLFLECVLVVLLLYLLVGGQP
jgi:NADH:ubiquinone oxidoreductase subunit 5 (subunit L)/multisubunit Na+/H+ antiporter MnhA subunit